MGDAKGLAIAAVILQALDYTTTKTGLAIGLKELNPLLQPTCCPCLLLAKLFVACIIIFIYQLRHKCEKTAKITLIVITAVYSLGVISNIALIIKTTLN